MFCAIASFSSCMQRSALNLSLSLVVYTLTRLLVTFKICYGNPS